MTIRILADREPYASFSDENSSFPIVNGPAELDAPGADFVVLPAEDLLLVAGSFPRENDSPRFIAYGSVAFMEEAFEAGAADYLREPWSLLELRARLERLLPTDFVCGSKRLSLEGAKLCGRGSVCLSEAELSLLRLLLSSAPLPVTKAAAAACLSSGQASDRALGRLAASLRAKLDEAEPGLGSLLHAVRGLGYRFDAKVCG